MENKLKNPIRMKNDRTALILEKEIFDLIGKEITPNYDHFFRQLKSYEELELFDQPQGKLVMDVITKKNYKKVLFNFVLKIEDKTIDKTIDIALGLSKYSLEVIFKHEDFIIEIDNEYKTISLKDKDLNTYSHMESRFIDSYANFLKMVRDILEEIIEIVMTDIHEELEEKFQIFSRYKSNRDKDE